MSYKNILNKQIAEFNSYYKKVCKLKPYLSIAEKKKICVTTMKENRGITHEDLLRMMLNPLHDVLKLQYSCEVLLTEYEVDNNIPRYYLKDDSLLDFFKSTEISSPIFSASPRAIMSSYNTVFTTLDLISPIFFLISPPL